MLFRGEPAEITAAYPHSYPFFPPTVVGTARILDRHQDPIGLNYCLLENPARDWHPGRSVGALIGADLRRPPRRHRERPSSDPGWGGTDGRTRKRLLPEKRGGGARRGAVPDKRASCCKRSNDERFAVVLDDSAYSPRRQDTRGSRTSFSRDFRRRAAISPVAGFRSGGGQPPRITEQSSWRRSTALTRGFSKASHGSSTGRRNFRSPAVLSA